MWVQAHLARSEVCLQKKRTKPPKYESYAASASMSFEFFKWTCVYFFPISIAKRKNIYLFIHAMFLYISNQQSLCQEFWNLEGLYETELDFAQ